ncbi:MAG TPA: hypothetical protein VHQ21_06900, partial [Rhodanobacteraceae bacterium]|nr:hypothetical protein [Rhodanobacteraceae bacterium]
SFSANNATVRARTRRSENDSDPISPSDKSIAVLPFQNLSDEKANAFFADGMQDEILTKLSKIGALRVISRTSTQRYASAPEHLAEIARQLGVANILEGSVQKAGNAVHINVQLIRASTDEHLWAESYNRTLDDIFGVEGEVAQAVAEALKATLTGAERQVVAAKGTENAKAYEAYLRGRAADNSGASFLGQVRAVDNYLEAVREDPNFAQAWALTAVVMSNLYFNGFDAERSTPAAVRDAAETAMRLQPQLAESLLARGAWMYRVQRDFPAANALFKQALSKEPGNVDILVALLFVERRQGLWNDSIAHFREAMGRNPRDASLAIQGGSEIYFHLRRYEDVQKLTQQALTIAPDSSAAYSSLAQVEQRLGNLDAADAWLEHVPKESNEYYERIVHSDQLTYRRNAAGLAALMAPALAGPDNVLTNADVAALIHLGYAQRAAGQTAVARALFERLARAFASRPGGIDHVTGIGPLSPLVYAGLGDWDRAIAAARHQIEFTSNDVLENGIAKMVVAQVYAQKGDRDAAVALLPGLLSDPGDVTPALLALDPMWDPIRDDARFVALTRQPLASYKLGSHD